MGLTIECVGCSGVLWWLFGAASAPGAFCCAQTVPCQATDLCCRSDGLHKKQRLD